MAEFFIGIGSFISDFFGGSNNEVQQHGQRMERRNQDHQIEMLNITNEYQKRRKQEDIENERIYNYMIHKHKTKMTEIQHELELENSQIQGRIQIIKSRISESQHLIIFYDKEKERIEKLEKLEKLEKSKVLKWERPQSNQIQTRI